MKKIFYPAFILAVILGLSYAYAQDSSVLGPYQDSYAYKQFSHRPKSELSKIYYLMDRYTGSPYKVIYDGGEFDSAASLRYAKSYVAKYYRKENATAWVKENAYRSQSGQPIYIKAPDGKTELLRDALVRELKNIGG